VRVHCDPHSVFPFVTSAVINSGIPGVDPAGSQAGGQASGQVGRQADRQATSSF
jgi:hypothetical protein